MIREEIVEEACDAFRGVMLIVLNEPSLLSYWEREAAVRSEQGVHGMFKWGSVRPVSSGRCAVETCAGR